MASHDLCLPQSMLGKFLEHPPARRKHDGTGDKNLHPGPLPFLGFSLVCSSVGVLVLRRHLRSKPSFFAAEEGNCEEAPGENMRAFLFTLILPAPSRGQHTALASSSTHGCATRCLRDDEWGQLLSRSVPLLKAEGPL